MHAKLLQLCLFVTLWTIACQAPLSMGFSRQEHWSGLPFPSPGYLSDPGIKPRSPALQPDSLLSEPPGKLSYVLFSELPRSVFWCLALSLRDSKLLLFLMLLPFLSLFSFWYFHHINVALFVVDHSSWIFYPIFFLAFVFLFTFQF